MCPESALFYLLQNVYFASDSTVYVVSLIGSLTSELAVFAELVRYRE